MKKAIFAALMLLMSLKSYEQTQGTIPILNSDVNSLPVVYLDFNGQYVTGSPWNWNGPINAASSGLSNVAMKEIFASVAVDYRIFKVNITTDPAKYSAAPPAARMRVIVTTTSSWYGSAGGVSYVGSYTWGDETPCWVFSALLNYDPKKVAEAISHESGHTLGLQHQSRYDVNCSKVNEYNPGSGTFSSGWSPIMGISYYTNASTWMKGSNTLSCSTIQDDVATIAGYPNNLSIRTDDAGNTYTTARTLNVTTSSIKASGIITTPSDKDVYFISNTTLRRFQLKITPESAGAGDKAANLNIKLSLLNKVGGVIKSYSPSTMSVSLDTMLRPARYYLVVEGVSSTYLPDYGSLGRYTIQGTATATTSLMDVVNLKGSSAGNTHSLEWSVQPDINVKDVEILQSEDGKSFMPVRHVKSGSSYNNYLANAATRYYQVKVTDENEEQHLSKVLLLTGAEIGGLSVVANATERTLRIMAAEAGDFEIFTSNGQLYQRGKVIQGYNLIQVSGSQKGMFVLKGITRSGSSTVKFIFP